MGSNQRELAPPVRLGAGAECFLAMIDAKYLFRLDVLQEEPDNPAPATAEIQNPATRPHRADMRLVALLEKSVRLKSLAERLVAGTAGILLLHNNCRHLCHQLRERLSSP